MHTAGSSRFSLKHKLQHDKQNSIPLQNSMMNIEFAKAPPPRRVVRSLYYKRERSLQTLVGIIHVKVGNDEIVFISESEI